MEGYNPQYSQVKNDKLAEFIMSPITGDLLEVPGIGPVAKERLFAQNVTTTFALIGKFYFFRREGETKQQHCDRFYFWLKDAGISACRSGITCCIVEKADTLLPDFYAPEEVKMPDSKEHKALAGDLSEISGITPYIKQLLCLNGVNNSYELIDKFLSIKQDGESENEDYYGFSKWLYDIGIRTNIDEITRDVIERSKLNSLRNHREPSKSENCTCF